MSDTLLIPAVVATIQIQVLLCPCARKYFYQTQEPQSSNWFRPTVVPPNGGLFPSHVGTDVIGGECLADTGGRYLRLRLFTTTDRDGTTSS
jgi:hypothetical protein